MYFGKERKIKSFFFLPLVKEKLVCKGSLLLLLFDCHYLRKQKILRVMILSRQINISVFINYQFKQQLCNIYLQLKRENNFFHLLHNNLFCFSFFSFLFFNTRRACIYQLKHQTGYYFMKSSNWLIDVIVCQERCILMANFLYSSFKLVFLYLI